MSFPAQKLELKLNHPVGIKGSSLTAVDPVRTLGRCNGKFESENNKLVYKRHRESKGIQMLMHSRNGLLPAVRFQLEDSHMCKGAILSDDEIKANLETNDGFLSLDYVFEKNFMDPIKEKVPEAYKKIKGMNMEVFVNMIMTPLEYGAFPII